MINKLELKTIALSYLKDKNKFLRDLLAFFKDMNQLNAEAITGDCDCNYCKQEEEFLNEIVTRYFNEVF